MEAKDFDKQLLERSYRELIKLTKELNMGKRIKAKTGHLRGAAWHAAREGNKIVMTNVKDLQDDAAKAQQEAVAIVPPTWQSLNDIGQAGRYVMRTDGNYEVVRVARMDRGNGFYNQVENTHYVVANYSQFQKIKD